MSDNKGNKKSIKYPNIISYGCAKKIIEQMEKNICKIKLETKQATGFFCKIPFPDLNNMMPVLIINNHVINENEYKITIKIREEDESRIIYLNDRLKYTNKEYDITILEIKENEINNYLELDDNIINDILNNNNKNEEYLDESLYIIQYPNNKLSVSYGILNNIYENEKYNFHHRCNTNTGSSGSPILNINNNKIIGIHKKSKDEGDNTGLFLNYPIKEFIKLYFNNKILEEFNKKYNLNIKDTNSTKLDLSNKKIENQGLKELCKIKFKRIKFK